MKKLNIIGLRFEKLTVLCEVPERTKQGKVLFECKCDCGNIINVIGSKLKNGWTKSCSCLQKEVTSKRSKIDNKTHGLSKTSIYTTYHTMIHRCNNPKNESYIHYGGRGIKVCNEWLKSFENFFEDMGEKPTKNHSIDRIDVDGNYEPSNCRWATKIEQENNKTDNRIIFYKGKNYTMAKLSKLLNINYSTLWNRTVRKNIFVYE
jgi:hypothetical protein